uniref:Uncharacterized protein n=1 Tax=Setaria italica TaxID=4555 RepID=K3YBU0_SETIT
MWKLLKQTFILPRSEELRKRVKHYARKQLDESFRRWRGELNDNNIHKVHLGPGGYRGKIDKWRQDREAAIAAGQPDPFEGLDERGWQWLAARNPTIVDGKPTFSTSESNQLAETIYDHSERQRKGEFVPNRDKNVLSSALGTKEHGGHVRGVSSKLTIKDGFKRDRASYKSHSRYKDDLREEVEKALESRFKDFLLATLAEQQQSVGRAGKAKEVAKGYPAPLCMRPASPAAASEQQLVATPTATASEPVDWPEDHPPPAQASPLQQQVDLPDETQQQHVDLLEEGHWIAFIIQSKNGVVTAFDSLDYD